MRGMFRLAPQRKRTVVSSCGTLRLPLTPEVLSRAGLSTAGRAASPAEDCDLNERKAAYMTMRLAVLECSFSSSLRRICRLVCTRTQRGT